MSQTNETRALQYAQDDLEASNAAARIIDGDLFMLMNQIKKAAIMWKDINYIICEESFSFVAENKPIFDKEKLTLVSMQSFVDSFAVHNRTESAVLRNGNVFTGSFLNDKTFYPDWNKQAHTINAIVRRISHHVTQGNTIAAISRNHGVGQDINTLKFHFSKWRCQVGALLLVIVVVFFLFHNIVSTPSRMAEYSDGNVYEGEFDSVGKAHGVGTMHYKNGDEYNGDWIHGQRWGSGIMRTARGIVYDGDWLHDKRDGQGTESHPSGKTYSGGWSKDKRNGHGMMKNKKGESFEGNWVEDIRQGVFTISSVDGSRVANVTFLNDKPIEEDNDSNGDGLGPAEDKTEAMLDFTSVMSVGGNTVGIFQLKVVLSFIALQPRQSLYLKRRLTGHQANVKSLTLHPSGLELATAAGDGLIKLWDTELGRAIWSISYNSDFVQFDAEGERIFAVQARGEIAHISTATGEVVDTVKMTDMLRNPSLITRGPCDNCISAAGSDNSNRFAMGTWRLDSGQKVAMKRIDYPAAQLVWSKKGDKALLLGSKPVCVDQDAMQLFSVASSGVAGCWSADGSLFATTYRQSGRIGIFSGDNGGLVMSLSTGPMSACVWSNTGNFLAVKVGEELSIYSTTTWKFETAAEDLSGSELILY